MRPLDANPSEHERVLDLAGVLFYGDPHGRWEPLLDSLHHGIHTVIILGDLAEAKRHPEHVDGVREALKELSSRGIYWRTISGNHDTDTSAMCDLMYDEFSDRLLDGKISHAGPSGIAIAGLGGVVRGKIWDGLGPPAVRSPEDLLARTPRQNRHRGGLPLKSRSAIYAATVDRLAEQRADILVSHEAPTSHEHGFLLIDALAEAMGVKLIVHGHHHVSYASELGNGARVRGLGLAEVWQPQGGTSACQGGSFMCRGRSAGE